MTTAEALRVICAEGAAANTHGASISDPELLAATSAVSPIDVRRVRALLCEMGLLAVLAMGRPAFQLQLPRKHDGEGNASAVA